MTKPELIAALTALSEKLGRPLSTEGNVADLEARLAEAQAEAELLDDEQNDEPVIHTVRQNAVAQKNEPSTSSGSGDRRYIRVLHAMDVFHYPAGRDVAVRAIVQPGEVIEVSAEDAADCVAAGYAEEA
ncbi:hypothetical protein QCK43_000713 [Enterobacter cancerogenus]|nr:hypothetical protein [Enterobacter cancerogenus]